MKMLDVYEWHCYDSIFQYIASVFCVYDIPCYNNVTYLLIMYILYHIDDIYTIVYIHEVR